MALIKAQVVALGPVVAQDRENALIDARNRQMVARLGREIRTDELAAKLARIRGEFEGAILQSPWCGSHTKGTSKDRRLL